MDDGSAQPTNEGLPPTNQIASQPVPTGLENNSPVTPAAAKKQKSKKTVWMIASLLVIVILVIAGILLIKHSDKKTAAAAKVYKVGILDGLDSYFGSSVAGFEQGMTNLGYIKGKTITYDVEKKPLTGNKLIFKKFIADKDNLVLVFPTEPTQEAEEFLKGSNIPIISLNASVEGSNIINSIQQPGHDVAGVRFPGPEDSVERLDVLHEIIPTAKKVLVPYLAGYPNVPAQLEAVQAEALKLGITVTALPLAAGATAAYVATLSTANPGFDAIVGLAEPLTVTPALNGPLYAFANQHNIPIIGGSVNNDDTGPLASVAPNGYAVGQLGATLAGKIFKGSPAGSLPFLTAISDLEVNLKVANRLGVTPDAGLLSTATEIIR